MRCGICSDPASHYYRTVGGENAGRCHYHASQFGYPEYLVELNPPKPAIRQPGYVIVFNEGDGQPRDLDLIWPFEEELAEFWVGSIADVDKLMTRWLVSDAAYEPYQPMYLEQGGVTVEVVRVTCLALVQV